MAFEGHAEVAEDEQDAAEHDGFAHAQPAVGEQAAEHGNAVDQAAVGAEQVKAGLVAEQVVLGEVQQQQRLHAVEREALPHLGKEADVDAFGVAKEVVGSRQGGGGHRAICDKTGRDYHAFGVFIVIGWGAGRQAPAGRA
ncbi:hypothetical protein D9M71_629030 [compost metagenome]